MNIESSQKGLLFASVTALSWSFLAIGVNVACQYIDTNSLVWSRFTVASFVIGCLSLIWAPNSIKILRRPPPLGIIAALFLAANYYGFMHGLKLSSPGNAQIFIQIGPIIVAVFGVLYFKEKLKPLQTLGFALIILGFLLFYNDQLNNLLNDKKQIFNEGRLWVIFGAVTWAGFTILQKKLVRAHHPQHLNLLTYIIASLVFLPQADFQALSHLTIKQWGILLYLGLNTVIAYGCLGQALKYADSNKVSVIITLNPLLTLVCIAALSKSGVSWVQAEPLSHVGYIGALIIVMGSIIVLKKPTIKRARQLGFNRTV